jgi:hypothetical protein
LVLGFVIGIAPSYILSQIELGAKGYGLKHSIANLMNQPSCTLNATIDQDSCKWQPVACQLHSDWLQMIRFLVVNYTTLFDEDSEHLIASFDNFKQFFHLMSI